MTRYEFAAGLNACLDRVNELIATATTDLVTKEDLATLQSLREQFSPELATLRGRVDAVEVKAAELEANQFSTTTKLTGEVVAVVSDVLGGRRVNDERIEEENTTLGVRARVEFTTSFTGKMNFSPESRLIILSALIFAHQRAACILVRLVKMPAMML
jgi:hypothetical protein